MPVLDSSEKYSAFRDVRPGDVARYLQILILRTAGLTYERVCELLDCGRQTVSTAERWFGQCRQDVALALVSDQRIKKLVDKRFPDIEFDPEELIRAARITGDDILLHYGRIPPPEDKPARVGGKEIVSNLVNASLLLDHWDRLRELATALQRQLSPPGVEDLFGAEACRRLDQSGGPGVTPLPGASWVRLNDLPFQLRAYRRGGGRALEVTLPPEHSPLFPHLVVHLETEFAEFARWAAWKDRLGRLVKNSLEVVWGETQRCRRAAGIDYLEQGGRRGLTYYFPAHVCQVVASDSSSDTLPGLNVELQPDGLWRLASEESPAIALALASEKEIGCCHSVFLQEVERNNGLKVWQDIRRELAGLKAEGDRLQALLATPIERRTFEGACPLCQGYLGGTSVSD